MQCQLLTTAQMAAGTAPWVGGQAGLFNDIDAIKAFFGDVLRVHAAVVSINTSANKEIAESEIGAQLAHFDTLHDQTLRALDGSLLSAARWNEAKPEPDPDRARALTRVRELLLPDGLRGIGVSYSEEAGRALRVMRRLTPAMEGLLRSVSLDDVDLLTLVRHWEGLGQEMNSLLQKRAVLSREDAVNQRLARQEWQRIVSMIFNVLEVTGVDPARASILTQPIREMVEAQQRRLKARASQKTDDAVEPEADATPSASEGEEIVEVTVGESNELVVAPV